MKQGGIKSLNSFLSTNSSKRHRELASMIMDQLSQKFFIDGMYKYILSFCLKKQGSFADLGAYINPKGGRGGAKMTLWVFDWLPFLTGSCYGHKNS